MRVGLEDGVYLSKGVLAESNAVLVEKARRIVEDLGGQIANARETRAHAWISTEKFGAYEDGASPGKQSRPKVLGEVEATCLRLHQKAADAEHVDALGSRNCA